MFVDIWLSWQQFWPLKRKSATRGQPYGLKPLEVGYRIHFLTYFCDFFTIIFENASESHLFAKIEVIRISERITTHSTSLYFGELFLSENRSDFIVAKNEWRNVRNLQYQFHPFFVKMEGKPFLVENQSNFILTKMSETCWPRTAQGRAIIQRWDNSPSRWAEQRWK